MSCWMPISVCDTDFAYYDNGTVLLCTCCAVPPLVLKASHLSGSAFCGLDLPEQAMRWMVSPLRFGIGSRR